MFRLRLNKHLNKVFKLVKVQFKELVNRMHVNFAWTVVAIRRGLRRAIKQIKHGPVAMKFACIHKRLTKTFIQLGKTKPVLILRRRYRQISSRT